MEWPFYRGFSAGSDYTLSFVNGEQPVHIIEFTNAELGVYRNRSLKELN